MAEPPRSDLVALLDHAVGAWPDRPAWTFDDGTDVVTLTFAEVGARVGATAAGLVARGVGSGDRVAVMLDNRPELPLTWLALHRLGAAMVPLNTRYRSVDAGHVVADSGTRLAVTSPAYAEVLRGLPGLEVVDAASLPVTEGAPSPLPAVEVDGRTTANVQYTSGTTGRPKGCVLSHGYWTTLAGSLVDGFPRIGPDDVMLTAQPFYYIDPQWNLVTAMLAGAHLVVLDGFHPSTFWAKAREHRVTYFYCLASMPTLLMKMPPDPLDRDHRVRVVQCSAIPPSAHAAIEERWGVGWYECFGMTETGADIRVTDDDHDELVGTGCLGRPAAHREARVVDGELWLRGPGMMDGYLGLPDPFEEGGWFRTGDLARIDDAGRVHLQGRLKDMIRRSGENVAAHEVEEVLTAHPAVRLAAVVGVPDEVRGEEVRAYVVAPGASAEELTAWCRERLASFKVPTSWVFRDELPLTASHRVAKAQLA
ncbi:AMP-binding protein [Nocardioides sp. SYSU D00038]|uniref:AMP-binding protein n=1 Tax=Nocardioides sp. SYSU D00038 TaxID=2812554 RepID=UPI0019678DBB|nr:AMP-binding protein [Nocardioides sp. SYSU D00038]